MRIFFYYYLPEFDALLSHLLLPDLQLHWYSWSRSVLSQGSDEFRDRIATIHCESGSTQSTTSIPVGAKHLPGSIQSQPPVGHEGKAVHPTPWNYYEKIKNVWWRKLYLHIPIPQRRTKNLSRKRERFFIVVDLFQRCLGASVERPNSLKYVGF